MNSGSSSTSSQTERDTHRETPYDSPYVNVSSLTVPTLPTNVSTLMETKTEKPIKKVPVKKSTSKTPVLPSSPPTCLCGSPECHGAEAYDALVNKAADIDFRRAAPVMMQHPGTFNELRECELVEGQDDSYPVILPLHSCPSPSCAKEYENLVKKAQTVDPDVPWKHVKSVLLESREHDYINLTLRSPSPPGFDALPPPPRAISRAHQSSPPPSPQFPGPRRCCSIM
ncbi:hypothetical protein CRE_13330 [Caenorhabditis remanei]|uniref:Uncharacterized protein n=1 Tax=Caenorhabditis remanei TaxID=31234 RepID=E3M884_CAERE|nr:hypothetical protein CRE_13330 [Caenorhabditis remanei]